MTEREKLIELINNVPKIPCIREGRATGKTFQTTQNIADHLLANGVIVPPCKVGDEVYIIDYYWDCDINGYGVCDEFERDESSCEYCPHILKKIFIREIEYKMSMYDDIGKTVFLTKEEAEKALQGVE